MTIAHSSLIAGSILDEQIQLEERAVTEGVARYNRLAKEAVQRGDGASLKPAERLLVFWFTGLAEAIRKDQRHLGRGKAAIGAAVWGPSFRLIDADRLAYITLHEMIGACMKDIDGTPRAKLSTAIGRGVLAEINTDLMREEDANTARRRRERLAAGEDKRTVYEQERSRMEDLTRRFRSLHPGRVNWWAKKTLTQPQTNRSVQAHIGERLIYHACEVCNASFKDGVFRLAFHRTTRQENGKTIGIVKLDSNAFDIIDQGHDVRQYHRPRYLPMLVPPYPWSKTTEGGYAQLRTPFISKPTKEQKKAIEDADLDRVYEALSIISGTAWRVNRRILGVMEEIWNSGGGELGIPHRSNLPDEPKPAGYNPNAGKRGRWAGVDPKVKRSFKRASAEVKKENIHRVSLRREFLAKLGIAQEFQQHEAIYFPHQFDFRGRMYAIPIHLNHQGDDLSRGLLEFSEAKTPGERGTFWLRVHAASVYGIDKCSFDKRVQWVMDHWQLIVKSAEDPLNTDWWRHADESEPGKCDGKPWQFLAACIALVDPEAGARLPVQVDGTCNGLQHFTALGRDEVAAPALNMIPADEPKSVYVEVAKVTDPLVRSEASSNPVAASLIARVGKIDKPLVKQPIMTTSYGVTEIGAREQVSVQLKKRGFEGDDLYNSSRYLSDAVRRSIGDVCKKAVEIMDWIQECCSLVTATGELFRWTSPIGFPVVQPYRDLKPFEVKTVLGSVWIVSSDETAPVHPREQVNGSAPNVIHSYDAAHLMYTAIICETNGITRATIAAVHDAYWSHAATMDFVHDVAIPDAFVSIHTSHQLENLLNQWQQMYPSITFPDPPAKGTYDIDDFYRAPYSFH